MKIYTFSRETIIHVHADSEEDARRQLVDEGYIEDEFELRDVRDEE